MKKKHKSGPNYSVFKTKLIPDYNQAESKSHIISLHVLTPCKRQFRCHHHLSWILRHLGTDCRRRRHHHHHNTTQKLDLFKIQLLSGSLDLVYMFEMYLDKNLKTSSTTKDSAIEPSSRAIFLTYRLYKPMWRSVPNIHLRATRPPRKIWSGKCTQRCTIMVKMQGEISSLICTKLLQFLPSILQYQKLVWF